MKEHGPFVGIVHFAAVLPERINDDKVLKENLSMTMAIATAAKKLSVSRVVYASSCRVYSASEQPSTEGGKLKPPDAYALGKLLGEQILREHLRPVGIHVASLRISAPYGEAMRIDTVVPRFVRAAIKGAPIRLLGTGSRTQHFVHQDDIARAAALALHYDADGVFNVADEKPVTMRELAELALRAADQNAKGRIFCEGEDHQEQYRGNFPTGAARRAFGYVPSVALEPVLVGRTWSSLSAFFTTPMAS